MWQIAKEEQLIEELEADAEEHPFEDGTDEEEPERKKLKRELRAEALARLEDSARTQREFENVIAWWDRLDANRERRERYHELSRSARTSIMFTKAEREKTAPIRNDWMVIHNG